MRKKRHGKKRWKAFSDLPIRVVMRRLHPCRIGLDMTIFLLYFSCFILPSPKLSSWRWMTDFNHCHAMGMVLEWICKRVFFYNQVKYWRWEMKNLKGLFFIVVFALISISAVSQVYAQPPGPPIPGDPRYTPPPPPSPPPEHPGYCVDRCRDHFHADIRGCRAHARPGYHRRCERQANYRYHRCKDRCRYR